MQNFLCAAPSSFLLASAICLSSCFRAAQGPVLVLDHVPIVATDLRRNSLLGLEIRAGSTLEHAGGDFRLCEAGDVLFAGSRIACEEQRLQILQQRHGGGNFNLRLPTLGGKQYWTDYYIKDSWRIQQHIGTKHFRLLDESDVRYAWGSYAACRVVLASMRLQAGLETGAEKAQLAIVSQKRRAVVLLHGIVRSKDSLALIEQHLSAAGYECLNVNYPSRKGRIEDFSQQIHAILNQRPDIDELSFVTHSMGGLILRDLLADDQQPWRQQIAIKNAVLLFPPNQGAYKANIWHKHWWYRCIFGPAGTELCTDVAAQLPLLPLRAGIIIGRQASPQGKSWIIPGNDDGTVGVEECRLAGDVAYAYHPVGHTYGMNDPAVIADVLGFISAGHFAAVGAAAKAATKVEVVKKVVE